MPDARLRVDARGPITEIVFDNPPINIYDVATRDELCDVLAAVIAEPDVRVVVYRAMGEHFSAGADLREFGTAPSLFAMRDARWGRDVWGLLRAVEVPMIASMHGNAVGFGFELALQCDYRIAADDCVVALPEARIGMIPAGGATQTLAARRREVGRHPRHPHRGTGRRHRRRSRAGSSTRSSPRRAARRAPTSSPSESPPARRQRVRSAKAARLGRRSTSRSTRACGARPISPAALRRVASLPCRSRKAPSHRFPPGSGPRGVRQAPATRALVDAERVVRARFPCRRTPQRDDDELGDAGLVRPEAPRGVRRA